MKAAVSKNNPRLDNESANIPDYSKKSDMKTATGGGVQFVEPSKPVVTVNSGGNGPTTTTFTSTGGTNISFVSATPGTAASPPLSPTSSPNTATATATAGGSGNSGAAAVAPAVPVPEPETAAETPRANGELEKVVALYDYTAEEEGELTFTEGDVIYILAQDPSGWWRGRTEKGEEGDFPSNYVGPPDALPEGDAEDPEDSPTNNKPSEPEVPAPTIVTSPAVAHDTAGDGGAVESAPAAVAATAAVVENGGGGGGEGGEAEGEEDDEDDVPVDASFVALYDYEAEEEGELTILKDQVLYVFTERGGWFYGKNDSGAVGLFPSNYVERSLNP